MRIHRFLMIAALCVVIPATAHAGAALQEGGRGDPSPQECRSPHDHPGMGGGMGMGLRALLRQRGLGVTLDDYIACVGKCKDLFPNEPALSTCITGCRSLGSKLQISID